MARTGSATVTIQPIQTKNLEMTYPEMFTIEEDGSDEHDRASGPDVPRSSNPFQDYPVYPGLQSSPGRVPGTPPPTALNMPRKLSNSSASVNSPTSPTSTMFSRESIRSEIQRSSSWGSKTSFESMESATWRPVENGRGYSYGYRTPEPLKRQRTLPQPDEVFAALPAEVLELILDNLKMLHLGSKATKSNSCATCWMRDLCCISLASRKWCKFARDALYEDIQLIGPDSAVHKKKFKLAQGSRMLLLRKTLRSNPELASLVRSIKVPRPEVPVKGNAVKSMEQYDDLTASLVMACPNLERLVGPPSGYDHSFKKLFHALSTRTQLKEMNWVIEPSSNQKPKSPGASSKRGGSDTAVELDGRQEGAFLDHHREWSLLTSLSMHCQPGATLTPDSLLTRTLSMLPSLQHLHLSNLPPDAFNDTTLLNLPPLHTLSLTQITGITSNGLSAFATQPGSQPLRNLHLRHTPLTNLAALARIFSNLTSLTSFSLAQAFPPLMPEDDSFTLWMMPYLASRNLHKLHWDITSHKNNANVADDILARSIAAGGFPQLRLLRTPNDPDAIFQDLCRPVERIHLRTDQFCVSDMRTPSFCQNDMPPPSPARLLARSPKTPQSPLVSSTSGDFFFPAAPMCTDLRIARLSAQTRLEKARARPRFGVNVIDEDGSMVDRFNLGGYIGTVGSQIRYHLLPDEGSSDDKGGVVDARDLAGDAGESLVDGKEGCTGMWNRFECAVEDKKEKERWWHTERGRWSRIELQ